MKRVSLLFQLVILVVFFCFSGVLHAYRGGGVTVLVGKGKDSGGFEFRLKAELESEGFSVKIINVNMQGDPKKELEESARKTGAGAAVLFVRSSGAVKIWITDKLTGKIIIRSVTIPNDNKSPDSFIALSTVELLRASFFEVPANSSHSSTVKLNESIQKKVVSKKNEELYFFKKGNSPDRYFLEMGPSLFVASFEEPPMVNMQIGFGLRVYKLLRVSIIAQIPLSDSSVESPYGSARVRSSLVGGGAGIWSYARNKKIYAGFTAGWVMVVYPVNGTPFKGYKGHEKVFITSAPYIRGGVSFKITQAFQIKLDTMAGWSVSQLQIRFAEEETSSFGHFFIWFTPAAIFVW